MSEMSSEGVLLFGGEGGMNLPHTQLPDWPQESIYRVLSIPPFRDQLCWLPFLHLNVFPFPWDTKYLEEKGREKKKDASIPQIRRRQLFQVVFVVLICLVEATQVSSPHGDTFLPRALLVQPALSCEGTPSPLDPSMQSNTSPQA